MNGSPSTQATTGTMLCLAKKSVGPNVVAQPSIPVMNGRSVNISILLSKGKKSGSEPVGGLNMRGAKPLMLQPPSWSFPQRVFRRPKSVEEFVCTLSVFVCFHPHAGADRVAVAEDVVHAGNVRPEFVVVQALGRNPRAASCSSGSGLGFGRAAGKSFCQSDELSDFPDFFHERFAGELFPHLQFHNVGSFSLCRCRIFSNCVSSRPDCWSICSMRALSLARPTLAAMATMCSARKIFADTPS